VFFVAPLCRPSGCGEHQIIEEYAEYLRRSSRSSAVEAASVGGLFHSNATCWHFSDVADLTDNVGSWHV
jgi:hypothetical protein